MTEVTEVKSKPVLIALDPPERSRRYDFPHGQIEIKNVTHFRVSSSGTHRLKTQDGHLHIVPVGWLHIELDVDDWTL